MNLLLQKKARGELSLGTFEEFRSAAATQIIGTTGMDYIIIDAEHCSLGPDEIREGIVAAECAGLAPLVRIGDVTRPNVLYPLDAGAKGLIIPAVETVEQVRRLVEYSKFTPMGNRGYFPSWDVRFGELEDELGGTTAYMDWANREELLIPQCETVGALEHIEEIMAMEGVDGIFVGPFDLSIAMGHPMEFQRPEFIDALKRILDACKKNDKLSIIFSMTPENSLEMHRMGFDSVTMGVDALTLRYAVTDMVRQVRNSVQ